MEEQVQPRNPNDLLIFQNVDTEDLEWQYDAIKTPLPYYIRAGETRELPFYIARHGVEKMIDRMLQKEHKLHTNPVLRAELRKKIVLGLRHINYIREKTPNEIALEDMQRKKDVDPYEELFKEREIEAERKRQAEQAAITPKAPLIETLGTPVQPIVAPEEKTDSPVVTTPQTDSQNEAKIAAFEPDRQNVYNLLRTKLHMDLTHQQTKDKLDAMPIEDLKREFATELPEIIDPSLAAPVSTPPVESIPTPAAPTPPPTPSISMNPQASAAPLLDQQLGVA